MAKLKYKDKDGFWQELPVGTNVVANPMLTGTEQELTSLQVGNAKYKSGGGDVTAAGNNTFTGTNTFSGSNLFKVNDIDTSNVSTDTVFDESGLVILPTTRSPGKECIKIGWGDTTHNEPMIIAKNSSMVTRAFKFNSSASANSGVYSIATTSDLNNYVALTGNQIIQGTKTFTATAEFNNGIATGGSNDFKVQGLYNISLPLKSGTLALTSDIPSGGGVDIAQINENILKDHTKTYFVVNTSNFMAAAGAAIPADVTVDWGDGSTSAAGTSFAHTYSDGYNVHLITVTGLTSISSNFLTNVTGVTMISISDSVTAIQTQAFMNCSDLEELYIGSGVTIIETLAIANCAKLTKVVVRGTVIPTLGTSVFTASTSARIMVPPSAVDAYRTNWSEYASQVGCEINSADLPGHIYLHRVSFDIVAGDTKGYFTTINNDNTALSSLSAARLEALLGKCFPAAIYGETYQGGAVSVSINASRSYIVVEGVVLDSAGQSPKRLFQNVNISDLSDTVTKII